MFFVLFSGFEFIDKMEEEIRGATLPNNTTTTTNNNSNSSSNISISNATTRKLSYLSSVESNITILSGIFPFSSQITSSLSSSSSSFDNIMTDHSKVCRYCLSDDEISEWLAPCKCIGTMKWVHLSCFEQWLSFAPYSMKYSCAICSYVYRRQWKLKPYKNWHWPQFHLRITDLLGIYFDITLTYRIYRYFPRCLDNRVTFFLYASYLLLWKLVVLSRMRLNFYSNIVYDIITSICSSKVLDAL
ncbi:unnamed protein product [Wuchereria bancrofti]|uniref:RING-CH-type domain-containing protein n=2 Tax=Wuchereria bancrofti TaxID=6293 RepID=A0A3P7DV13_WUCBA|nr:unnamed protein product [Wuchereria bancrofti]